MPDNDIGRVGAIAQVASAATAIAYPLIKAVNWYLERRRAEEAQRLKAAIAVTEARITERASVLERRVASAMAVTEGRLGERCSALERRVQELEKAQRRAA